MGKDIEDLVSQCDICAEHYMSNPRESMTLGEIPSRSWEFVSTDLFTFHSDDYLLIVDSFLALSKSQPKPPVTQYCNTAYKINICLPWHTSNAEE